MTKRIFLFRFHEKTAKMKFELWSLFRDKITYKIEDDFVYKMSFSSKPKIIGVVAEGNSVSRYHLFVEIIDFYQNLAYFAIFVLNLLVGKYYEKIFKTEKGLSLIFIPILFYIIIFIIT